MIVVTVTIVSFLAGYLFGDALTPSAVYWMRNAFGVAFLILVCIVILEETDLHGAFATGFVVAAMLVCWMVSRSDYGGYLPTWFANGWVELVVGVAFAIFTGLTFVPIATETSAHDLE